MHQVFRVYQMKDWIIPVWNIDMHPLVQYNIAQDYAILHMSDTEHLSVPIKDIFFVIEEAQAERDKRNREDENLNAAYLQLREILRK